MVRWVRGGDTLLGCEAARSPDDLDSPFLWGLFGCGGVWLVLPRIIAVLCGVVWVWGCFLRTA